MNKTMPSKVQVSKKDQSPALTIFPCLTPLVPRGDMQPLPIQKNRSALNLISK